MTNQNNVRLILGSKEFLITTDLSRIDYISSEIYSILKTKKEYKIKSNIREQTLIQFINHLVNKDIPKINNDNILEFEQLSDEFNHMKDLIEVYHSAINSKENYCLQKQNNELQNKINKYNRIFREIFENKTYTIKSKYLILSKNEMYEIIKTKDGEILDLKAKTIINHINGLSFILNEEDKTAEVFKVNKEKVSYYIPISIEYKSQNYIVTKIHENINEKFIQYASLIKFPENSKIQIIGKNAFNKLQIRKIKIPSSVIQIGYQCFSNNSIEKVEFSINSQLKIFDEYLFSFSHIKIIKIPSSVIKICKYAFNCCYLLKEIIFSSDSNIECIESFAFHYCYVEKISLPSKKIELKNEWCSQMSKLNQIVLLNNNNSEEFIKCINNEIFIGKNEIFDRLIISYRNIKEIHIPSYIKIICSDAFSNCNFLTKVTFSDDSQLQIIDDGAFSESSIESISIPSNVTHINDKVFYECKKLKNIEFSNDSKLQFIGKYSFSKTSIEVISIPSSVIEIGEYAFYYCLKLKTVEFLNESKLDKIGDSAFKSTSIKSINIPFNVTKIENEAFKNCENLEKVEFSNRFKRLTIGDAAFSGKIENISIPSNIIDLKEYCFIGMKKLIHISVLHDGFHENIKCINNKIIIGKSDINSDIFDQLIFSCHNVKAIHIPSSIKTICSYAFNNCYSLKKVTFSKDSKLENINNYAFYNCSITSIKIPSNVSKIDRNAFSNCRDLKSIEFPINSKLNEIKECCFEYTDLEKLLIPSSIEKIDHSAFAYCNNLKKVSFGQDSKIQIIGNGVFKCTNIQSISFPSSVLNVGMNCFENCMMIQIIEITENIDITVFYNNSYVNIYYRTNDFLLMIPNQDNN